MKWFNVYVDNINLCKSKVTYLQHLLRGCTVQCEDVAGTTVPALPAYPTSLPPVPPFPFFRSPHHLTMSASSNNSGGGSTQPLADVLPWGSPISHVAPPPGDSDDTATTSSSKSISRTLLITDSLSTDARFLLHTLALQFLSSKSDTTQESNDSNHTDTALTGSVLWISCGSPPVTEKQIANGLRKAMQHNLGSFGGSDSSSGSGPSNLGSVNVVSISSELANAALKFGDTESFSNESYIKRLHKRVVYWMYRRELVSDDKIIEKSKDIENNTSRGPSLIILDGISILATLAGDALAQMFVSSVSASLKKYTSSHSNSAVSVTNLLAIRCTSPDDGGLYNIADLNEFDDPSSANRTKGQKLRSEYSRLLRPWLGVGSSGGDNNNQIFHIEEQSHSLSLQTQSTPQLLNKSGWYEIVDAIVDVSPLESGYARDVLGRLSFATTWNGKGWWGMKNSMKGASEDRTSQGGHYGSICINYRCDDSGVRVMRLRSGK